MIILGEHPITKELRYIRICLVILVIVLLFFNSEKVVEISTNHDSIENVPTSNMTQIAENTFAIQEYNPLLSSENIIQIQINLLSSKKLILVIRILILINLMRTNKVKL